MTASPNFIYSIFDGDDSSGSNSATPPPGSGALERLFQADYDAFLKADIPVGKLKHWNGLYAVNETEQVV
jgi:hypothetical protein